MKHLFSKSVLHNPLGLLRKAGYFPFTDPVSKEDSFVLRLTADRYPRMHLYVEDHGDDWSFNLHLDQKQASYKGTSKHAGEYEGPVVEREMDRIKKWIAQETGFTDTAQTARRSPPTPPKPKQPPAGLFGGIF